MAAAAVTKAPSFYASLKRWAFYASGWNKYGLYRDDLLYETPDVEEALTRMPQKFLDERNYRILRATQLSLTKTLLPKEQWPSFEEDLQNRQLMAMVEQVAKERAEKEKWNSIY